MVSWGNFDGVHLGHRALLARLVARAAALGLPAVLITFEPHPALFFQKGRAETTARALADAEDKLALLLASGVDYVLRLPFDAAFARQSPEEFAREALALSLRAKAVVLGYDLAFGRGRAGGFELLRRLGLELGFSVESAPALPAPGAEPGKDTPVASTLIREAVRAGDFARASAMLGRRHSVHGLVRHGAARGGSLLGFPTANIDPGPLLLPPHGVYACLGKVDDALYPAAVNLGVNPSFGGALPSLEAHMLDFTGDLYGRDLRLYFLNFLRPERKFEHPEELRAQISLDVQETRRLSAKALAEGDRSAAFPL